MTHPSAEEVALDRSSHSVIPFFSWERGPCESVGEMGTSHPVMQAVWL